MDNNNHHSPVAALQMRKLLDASIAPPVWPQGICITGFDEAKLPEAYAVLQLAYKNAEGYLPGFEAWKTGIINDTEFDPLLCFILNDELGIAGIAQCWTSGFIKDFAIHPRCRNKGLGTLLLLQVFDAFKHRLTPYVDLKVYENNLPAIRLYTKSGMRVIERVTDRPFFDKPYCSSR